MIKNNSLLAFLMLLLILLAPITQAETIQIITYTSDSPTKFHDCKKNLNHNHKESLDKINSLLQSIKYQINQEFKFHHLDEVEGQPTQIQDRNEQKELDEVKHSQKDIQKVKKDIDQLQENEGHHKFRSEDKLKVNNSTIYPTVKPVSEKAEQTQSVLQTQPQTHEMPPNQQQQPPKSQKQSELFVIGPTANTSPQVYTIKKSNDEVNDVSTPITNQTQSSQQLKQENGNTSTNIQEIASQQISPIRNGASSSLSAQPIANYSESTNFQHSAFSADVINITNYQTESHNSAINPSENVVIDNNLTIIGAPSDSTEASGGSILIDPPMSTSTQQLTSIVVVPPAQNSVLSATSSSVQNSALPVETQAPISSNTTSLGYQSISNASTSGSIIIDTETNKSQLSNSSNKQQNSLLMPSDILTNQPTQVAYSKILSSDSLKNNSSLTFVQSICMPMCDYESTAPVCGDHQTCRACLTDSQCINEGSLFAADLKKYSIACDAPTGRCIKKNLNDI